jgi:two-component system, sensor histidine kinase and response regulator
MSTILLIEDAYEVRESVAAVLRFYDFDVLTAADGRNGLQLARQHVPDVIISDILMPGMDGYGLLRAVREAPETATIPVILLTAMDERADMRQGMTLGADDYLTKPFEKHELLSAIEVQLNKRITLADKYDTTLKLLRKNIIYALPHELYTPLHQIIGYAELLDMDSEIAAPGDIRESAQAIVRASARLHRLTENYLIYAQLELAASDPGEVQALRNHLVEDPAVVIAAAAQEIAASYNRSSDLKLKLATMPLHIAENNLRKIVTELVDNALKFSAPDTTILLHSFRQDGDFILQISDYGYGMSAEDINRVGAYMQFERALHEQQGVGLGLAIAKRLAELHRGKLLIESQISHGTVVSVQFFT